MASSDHPLFRNAPTPEAKLWRYLSFAKFASLLESAQLHFTRVDHFDDHFEGAWPESDLAYWTKERLIDVFKVADFTEQMRRNVAVSCWFQSPHESAAMWRLYAPGSEGVAVATTFGKLRNFVNAASIEADWISGAGRVTYLDHSNDGLIKSLRTDERLPNAMMPFMLKNISYEYEKEVRALIIAMPPREIPEEGFDLPLNLIDFVDGIVINPFCQTWFNKAVAGVAGHYRLGSKLRESSLSPDVFYIDRRKS
jgi:Protein of unknown function (DUF2971)